MKIWQMDTAGDPDSVDGVAQVLWPVCERLAAAGHDVTLFVRTPLAPEGVRRARAAGFAVVELLRERLEVKLGPILAMFREARPDVVQVHGPLIPQFAAVTRLCRVTGVRYVYTTHGGLAPEIIGVERTRRRRQLYSSLIESAVLRHAAAIVYCVESERFDVHQITRVRGIERVIAPPVNAAVFDVEPWRPPNTDRPSFLYLGRFDPYQKAVDRLVELFRLAPDLDLRLVGEPEPRDAESVEQLRRLASPNVSFHPPVHGAAKGEVLRSATMYLQFSRFEGFPVSVAEALSVGIPTAVITTLGVARVLEQHDLGLVVSADLRRAAEQLRTAAADLPRLMEWSERSRRYARRNFTVDAVAARYIELYDELGASSRR